MGAGQGVSYTIASDTSLWADIVVLTLKGPTSALQRSRPKLHRTNLDRWLAGLEKHPNLRSVLMEEEWSYLLTFSPEAEVPLDWPQICDFVTTELADACGLETTDLFTAINCPEDDSSNTSDDHPNAGYAGHD